MVRVRVRVRVRVGVRVRVRVRVRVKDGSACCSACWRAVLGGAAC